MASGLVEEIQKAAVDPNTAVSTLLRQVKLAAVKLKLDSVEDWVEAELNGYSNGSSDLPAYRKVGGSAMAQAFYGGWQPLMLSKETEFLRTASIGDSVASIESLLAKEDSAAFKQYPAELIASLSKANDQQIMQAGCLIQRSSFVAILDSVRNLVLDWAINLERAGVTGNGISFTAREQEQAHNAQSVITIGTINSMTGNLGVGITSGDITNAPLNIDRVKNLVSQIKSHAETLTNEGVDGPALTAALKATEEQLSKEHPMLLRQALGELEKVVVKASGGLVAHGVIAMLHQILGTGIPA